MPDTPPSSFRLKPETLRQIDDIRNRRGGLTRTRVIELAVAAMYQREGQTLREIARTARIPSSRR